MQNNISNGSNFGAQLGFVNNAGLNFNAKSGNNPVYYAKKGEPMYMKEMDSDEDGVVSFDEFKDYCDENGISVEERIKMTELASSYRVMQSQKRAEKNIQKKETKSVDTEACYAKRGDSKYNELMDTNNDDKITYREYIEYCKEHSKPQEEKSNTRVEETEDGNFKTVSAGKAINAYSQSERNYDE